MGESWRSTAGRKTEGSKTGERSAAFEIKGASADEEILEMGARQGCRKK